MTIFISQGRFTETAMRGFVAKPEDRALAVKALVEAAGARLVDYYITFGEYDFLVIMEGGPVEDALAALFVAGATGGVTNLKTTVAIRSADALGAMAKAGELAKSFRPAGS